MCGVHLQLVDSVVDNFGHFYPELVAKQNMISEIIRQGNPTASASESDSGSGLMTHDLFHGFSPVFQSDTAWT